MKNKEKLFYELQETLIVYQKMRPVITKKWTRWCIIGLIYKEVSEQSFVVRW